ncbi:reverse transcriptase domain-containing protein [Tanacetum coccineum]
MPTWCHMFNSTLTGSARVWFDELPPESIDSYDDLKKAFLANYLQQKKCVKDPVEIHHIKQRKGESIEDFVQRFKVESRHVKGAPECMRIFGIMHGINNPELIKRLHDNISKSVDEMMRVTTAFLRGEVAASNQRSKRRRDKFTLLTKSLKEILALDKGEFKAPPPMTTPVEKRNINKFCEFHREVGHNTDECMQIEELIKNGKLSHVIKELKQGSEKDQPKTEKKGETSGKDNPLAILMVQPWQRVARQKITKSFSLDLKISFPPLGDEDKTEGPMIIEAEIGGHFIHQIYVDGGSASEILYEHCFKRLCLEVKNKMVLATAPLIAFSGEIIRSMGQVLLLVKIRYADHFTSTWMNFVVVRSPSPYNGIIGRPIVRKIQAEAQPSDIIQAAEERIKVDIHPEYPEQTITIGSTLTEEGRKALCDLLRRSLDVFAWKPADMLGVSRYIEEHRLNVREGCSPVRQKKRSQAPERNKAIQEEVEKLVGAGIIKKDHYHSWLSNPVMVKKYDDSCRMCMDFEDLNKACPKDGYPLSEINWKVESLCGYPFKCILDAYKGYHQIKMAKEDEEKITFITSQGVFCYSKMPFGLKNAEATYQRLADKAFQKQIGRNLEVYVDDLVIKSRSEHEIIRDIEETFKTLREINMKLNPKKCTFGIKEGTFLGNKVNTEGIMVCLDKVGAVLNLASPKCRKDVQKLNGKLASLNRFLFKSAEKSLPFFKTLKYFTRNSDFQWTAEAEAAFKEMKKLIAELPTLTAPMKREELIMYLAAAREVVSAVLMTEREAKQMPVYFVSRALQGPEINYTSMEKLVLALVHASKRLKRYFQAHTIIVITDQPIKQILSRPEVTGTLQKWSIELGEYVMRSS